jgi:hypothetical protein
MSTAGERELRITTVLFRCPILGTIVPKRKIRDLTSASGGQP